MATTAQTPIVDVEKETRIEEKIQNGIADIKAGKGVSRKEGETVSQFLGRLCTE